MSVLCGGFSGLAVRVEDVAGTCPRGLRPGLELRAEAMTPEGMCPSLYQTLVPYLEAALAGAVFSRGPENSISVRCARPGMGAHVRVRGLDGEHCQVRFVEVARDCARHARGREDWEFPARYPDFCPAAFHTLFPVLAAVAARGGEGRASCPGCALGTVVMAVGRK